MNEADGYFVCQVFPRLMEARGVMIDLVDKQRVYVMEADRLEKEDKRNQWADLGYKSKAEFRRDRRMITLQRGRG